MNSKTLLFLVMATAVRASFLQTPDQFQSTFNSTFLKENDKIFHPIIIPNITKSSEQPPTPKIHNATTGNGSVVRKVFNPKEISQEATVRENYLNEEPKTTGNSLKFSSRYSTKLDSSHEELPKEGKDEPEDEKPREYESRVESTTALISNGEKNGVPNAGKEKSFSDRSDDLGDSEEEKDDTFKYDTNGPREAEQSEIASTTNEPFAELQRPTSFRSTPYPEDDLENYETTSTSAEETDSSEEREEDEIKRSVDDYYNSGSKNYHSIQTPLKQVKYRGPHSYRGSFEPEKVRTRLVSPISRHHDKPDWPYSRPKTEIQELNEISHNDEEYEKNEEKEVKEEVKTKPKQLDLELAVEKDEFKFDRNKKYNYIEEKNRKKQQQKNLAAEEEKDDKTPLFPNLKQYQVDEDPRHQPNSRGGEISKLKIKEDIWSSKPVITTPKEIFKTTTNKKPQQFGVANELASKFQGPDFLGPVVFNHNLDQPKTKPVVQPFAKQTKTQKVPIRSPYLKGLLKNEKIDQENLTNEKSIFGSESQQTQSFNHLEESDDMYNAILANIQSVFGIRTQSLKSSGASKGSVPEVNLEESRSLTWSLPLLKRTKVN